MVNAKSNTNISSILMNPWWERRSSFVTGVQVRHGYSGGGRRVGTVSSLLALQQHHHHLFALVHQQHKIDMIFSLLSKLSTVRKLTKCWMKRCLANSIPQQVWPIDSGIIFILILNHEATLFEGPLLSVLVQTPLGCAEHYHGYLIIFFSSLLNSCIPEDVRICWF